MRLSGISSFAGDLLDWLCVVGCRPSGEPLVVVVVSVYDDDDADVVAETDNGFRPIFFQNEERRTFAWDSMSSDSLHYFQSQTSHCVHEIHRPPHSHTTSRVDCLACLLSNMHADGIQKSDSSIGYSVHRTVHTKTGTNREQTANSSIFHSYADGNPFESTLDIYKKRVEKLLIFDITSMHLNMIELS